MASKSGVVASQKSIARMKKVKELRHPPLTAEERAIHSLWGYLIGKQDRLVRLHNEGRITTEQLNTALDAQQVIAKANGLDLPLPTPGYSVAPLNAEQLARAVATRQGKGSALNISVTKAPESAAADTQGYQGAVKVTVSKQAQDLMAGGTPKRTRRTSTSPRAPVNKAPTQPTRQYRRQLPGIMDSRGRIHRQKRGSVIK